MTKNIIIFDFDGTIADTLDAVVSIANRFALEFGYIPITPSELLKLKNLTAREILKYSGFPLFKAPFLIKKVKAELKNKISELQPIAGIKLALEQLNNQGYHLGIITSNSHENVSLFLNNHDLDYLFDFVYTGVTIFGKTTIINNVLRQKQIQPQMVVYVGDETRDIEASKKANIKVIAVSWGFNSQEALARCNPDILIQHPSELVDAVNSLSGL
jgi:phosphoglycolate phosphatase